MSINGKRDDFKRQDILAVAKQYGIRGAQEIISQVIDTVTRWSVFADEAKVPKKLMKIITPTHRLKL